MQSSLVLPENARVGTLLLAITTLLLIEFAKVRLKRLLCCECELQ
jgi:hypothetical protein